MRQILLRTEERRKIGKGGKRRRCVKVEGGGQKTEKESRRPDQWRSSKLLCRSRFKPKLLKFLKS